MFCVEFLILLISFSNLFFNSCPAFPIPNLSASFTISFGISLRSDGE